MNLGKGVPDFNSMPVPPGYVPGIGRGAMGFTTRSDIGPARAAPDSATAAAMLAKMEGGEEGDRADYSESNYDEFSGYGERLFATGVYDEDDREADEIYNSVDAAMDKRRKRLREQKLVELQHQKRRIERPRIADQFADLKRELSNVSYAQWDAIPDIGDGSLKLKQQQMKKENMVLPLPDSVILSANMSNSMQQYLQEDNSSSGLTSTLDSTSSSSSSMLPHLIQNSRSHSLLSSRLDKVSDAVDGQTVVDPQGYITSLNSLKYTSSAEIGDIKKARILLQSVTHTNPKHGPGWIAAARVEEYANKLSLARKVILQGCEQAKESEDVWLEAVRLHPIAMGKAILANAVKQIPYSVKLWMKAAELETSETMQKTILRRALEFIPTSVQLWKAAIALESVDNARILLARAVECVPDAVDMWLALAKLETHENARKVLNRAREAIPTERETWITAAKLEEAHGNIDLVKKIIDRMVASLAAYQVTIKREDWIADAVAAERAQAFITADAILRATLNQGIETGFNGSAAANTIPDDRKKLWLEDAEYCLTLQPPAIVCARSILQYTIQWFPHKKSVWQHWAMFEKEFGSPTQVEEVLKQAVQHCPQGELLWLMAAKEKWLQGHVAEARTILLEAFQANPTSEEIWLAAVKLEWENSEFIRARMLLQRARERVKTERVWMKSMLLERELSNYEQVLILAKEAITLYPNCPKLYLMAGQVQEENLHQDLTAREVYIQGLKANVHCIPLWCSLIRLDERMKGITKARSTGEMARLKLPKQEEIWLECIRLERRHHQVKLVETMMATALKECPKSALLWSEVLWYCKKVQQKSNAIEALRRCDQEPLVIVTIARLFERNARYRKASKWYERAAVLNPKIGDIWIYYYAFQYVQCFRELLKADGSFGTPRSQFDTNLMETDGGTTAVTVKSIKVTTVDTNTNEREKTVTEEIEKVPEEKEIDTLDDVDDDDDDEEETKGTTTDDHATTSRPTTSLPTATTSSSIADHLVVLHALKARCIEAIPNRGEVWCKISKQTEHRRKDIGSILLVAVEKVLGYPLVYLNEQQSSDNANS
jgi:pre-mRNA-processing factor 6